MCTFPGCQGGSIYRAPEWRGGEITSPEWIACPQCNPQPTRRLVLAYLARPLKIAWPNGQASVAHTGDQVAVIYNPSQPAGRRRYLLKWPAFGARMSWQLSLEQLQQTVTRQEPPQRTRTDPLGFLPIERKLRYRSK